MNQFFSELFTCVDLCTNFDKSAVEPCENFRICAKSKSSKAKKGNFMTMRLPDNPTCLNKDLEI